MSHPQTGTLVLAVAATCFVSLAGADDRLLLDAIRNDDVTAVRAQLGAGASPDARDESGTTALMYAAAFASIDSMRALLDRGAHVNVSSASGATALMWAAGDAGKVRLLLDHDAALDATMNDGTTALLAAARRGHVDVMRLLLNRKANVSTSAGARAELLRVVSTDRPDERAVLASAGIDIEAMAATAKPSLANYPASATRAIGDLLARGADPNPRGRFPFLALAAFDSRTETATLLLDHGANPNATGQHGATPLMMAVGAPAPDPATAQLLIQRGANVSTRDDEGRTALDWAMLQGLRPVAELLRRAGAKPGVPVSSAPKAAATPRAPRDAVEAALARLEPVGPVLYEQRKCISCHHQILPSMAMTMAARRGLRVDADAAARPIRATLEVWAGRRDALMVGREVAGGANELTYGLLMLAEAGVPRDLTTDAAVTNLISLQRDDGSWVFFDTRPPQADNSLIHFTAMAIRGLSVYTPPGLRRDVRTRLERARRFLRSAAPASTQDEAFKLMGLVWAGEPAATVAAQRKRLLALQRSDGGWAQLPTMTTDAYATGQALYALTVSGAPANARVYADGVRYLLRTQLDDGTWFVRSRAFGFQPYFESGFPHGRDQFISASATAWAVIGIAHAL